MAAGRFSIACVLSVAAGLSVSAPVAAVALRGVAGRALPQAAAAPLTGEQTAAQGAKLATAIRAELARRAGIVSAQDIEAVIMFVADQGNASDPVLLSALDVLEPGAGDNLAQAIANVRLALLKKKRTTGTGAVVGGSSFSGGNSTGFSTPGVSIGAGTANYAG